MYKKSITIFRYAITAVILFPSLAGAGGVLAGEEDTLEITAVDPDATCGDVQFTIVWTDVDKDVLWAAARRW